VIDPEEAYDLLLRRRADALATACVHAGEPIDASGALDSPIVLSSAFAFESADQAARAFRGEDDAWIYGRWGNPTVASLEEKLAAIEGAEAACATASGMAAIAGVVLATCATGDHIVAPQAMYAESARLFRERLPKLGISTTFVSDTADAYARAVTASTRILYVETPSNPRLGITDIADVAGIALRSPSRPLVVVDGTFATPFAQTPLVLGADLVVHSMTKGLSGHGDVIGGAIAGRRELVSCVRETVIKGFGGMLPPLSAWLVSRGLRTFALRQERACATAATLAKQLSADPRIAVVHHPSLTTHPGHAVARKQMHAYGSILSFELAGDRAVERGRTLLESLRVATHAVSLGDVRTLVVHPASTTHSTMPAETRRAAGIADGLLRVSCGLEGADDLFDDLDRAIAAATGA
jgi:methionine-gamma-lyase